MNEPLIKELATKAGCGYLYDYDEDGGHAMVCNVADITKLVELVVGECAGIYSRIDNGNLCMGTDDYLEALHKTFHKAFRS